MPCSSNLSNISISCSSSLLTTGIAFSQPIIKLAETPSAKAIFSTASIGIFFVFPEAYLCKADFDIPVFFSSSAYEKGDFSTSSLIICDGFCSTSSPPRLNSL
nr:MAG TPA: hypothetical protein [Caudoviricetes sp.]